MTQALPFAWHDRGQQCLPCAHGNEAGSQQLSGLFPACAQSLRHCSCVLTSGLICCCRMPTRPQTAAQICTCLSAHASLAPACTLQPHIIPSGQRLYRKGRGTCQTTAAGWPVGCCAALCSHRLLQGLLLTVHISGCVPLSFLTVTPSCALQALSYVSPQAVLKALLPQAAPPRPSPSDVEGTRVAAFQRFITDLEKRGGGEQAPEFPAGLQWFNAPPLKLSGCACTCWLPHAVPQQSTESAPAVSWLLHSPSSPCSCRCWGQPQVCLLPGVPACSGGAPQPVHPL